MSPISPPIHLYSMLVIDLMVPMCMMEVASRHLILVTSPPPTVAPVDPGSVSIMGLPPFKWVQEKVVLECEQSLDQARVM